MDAQGLEAQVLLPTLAIAVEEDLADDVDLTYASLRAFNRWLEEDWGYGADGRIYGVPLLSLLDLDRALAELARVLDLGAKLVHLRPGPIGGHSPAHPRFDPFWSTVTEAGASVVFHTSNSGYAAVYGTLWYEDPANPSHLQSPLQWALCNTERPLDRHADRDHAAQPVRPPPRRAHPVDRERQRAGCGRCSRPSTRPRRSASGDPMIGGDLPDRPSRALLDHLCVSPFPEDDVVDLIGVIGADHVLFGSDYPHPEGLSEPADFVRLLEGCDAETQRKVLRGNTAGLLGITELRPASAA